MRLIDADELLERMKKTPRYFTIKFDVEQSPTIDVSELKEIFEIVMPVVKDCYEAILPIVKEQMERPQGEWIENPAWRHHYMCSVCGKPCDTIITVVGGECEQLSNFCPDCGAYMRGTENEKR